MARAAKVYFYCLIMLFQLFGSLTALDWEICSKVITDTHLQYLDEMIDSQIITEGCRNFKVKLLKDELTPSRCFSLGSMYHLGSIFNSMKFKEYSRNYNHTKALEKLYSVQIAECVLNDFEADYSQEYRDACSRTQYLTPDELLKKAKDIFSMAQKFFTEEKPYNEEECLDFFENCDREISTGPSPDTPVLTRTANQKPPTDIAAAVHSTDSAIYSTAHPMDRSVKTPGFFQHMPTSLQGSPQIADTTSVTLTKISTESKFPGTNMKLPHTEMESQYAITQLSKTSKDYSYSNTVPSHANTNTLYTRMESLHSSTEHVHTRTETLLGSTEPVVISTENVLTSSEPVLGSNGPLLASTEAVVVNTETLLASTDPVLASTEHPQATTTPSVSSTEHFKGNKEPPYTNIILPHVDINSLQTPKDTQQGTTEHPNSNTVHSNDHKLSPHTNENLPYANFVNTDANTDSLSYHPFTSTVEPTLFKKTQTTSNTLVLQSTSDSRQELDLVNKGTDVFFGEMSGDLSLDLASSPSITIKIQRSIKTSDMISQIQEGTFVASTVHSAGSGTFSKPVSRVDQQKNSNGPLTANTMLFNVNTIPTGPSKIEFHMESEVQSLGSEVSLLPKKTVNEKANMPNNFLQQEGDLDTLISHDRENSLSGPNYGSNLLPIIETAKQKNENNTGNNGYRNVSIISIVVIVAIALSVSGLLYYRHKYKMLSGRLQRAQPDPEVPEERPLNMQDVELDAL